MGDELSTSNRSTLGGKPKATGVPKRIDRIVEGAIQIVEAALTGRNHPIIITVEAYFPHLQDRTRSGLGNVNRHHQGVAHYLSVYDIAR